MERLFGYMFRAWKQGRENYDTLIAAAAGYLFIYAYCRHGGIGVSPDSVIYISTAGNIHDHGLINDFTNQPVMDFPAGYPIFLSGILFLTGMDVRHFGPVLNGLLFAGLIFLCGWLMKRFTVPAKWYKRVLLACIVLSPCLLEVYSMIWSETLFLLLLLLFIICTRSYFTGGGHAMGTLIAMALIAGLACVTRYAGVTFIGMGGLLLLCDHRLRWKKKIVHLFVFGLIAAFPLALNIWRNQHLTDTLTGYREKGTTPFSMNLHDFGSVFCDWLPFFDERYGWAALTGAFFILFITGRWVLRLVRKNTFYSYENISATYFIVYAVFILFSATVSRFQQLDSRLLSPLFIPWLWGSSSWIPGSLGRLAIRGRRILLVASVAGAGCFLWGEWQAQAQNWEGIYYAGIPGYTEDQWTKSETISYVRKHKDSLQAAGTIYSNAFEGLWFLGGVSAELIPHKEFPADISYMMVEDQFTVIWFDDSNNDDLISIDYISRKKKLVSQLKFADGTIYYFKTDPAGTRADSTGIKKDTAGGITGGEKAERAGVKKKI